MPITSPDQAPFVTFYSYKGGVGRSMAVLNVASLLAARGFRILIIDFDLEAPGLSHLEPEEKRFSNSKTAAARSSGVIELLTDAKARGENADLFKKNFSKIASKFTFPYRLPSELDAKKGGKLFIMPAGRSDANYSRRLDDLDLRGLYSEGVGRGLMLYFKHTIATCGLYDYVLVDSRTGHSDEAGICTRDLGDHLMIVTGFNKQNLAGTAAFLATFRASLGESWAERKNPDIILSPVPIGEEALLAKQERQAAAIFSSAWGRKLDPNRLTIPYHPRLALSEDAYSTARANSDLKTAYRKIESALLASLDNGATKLTQNALIEIDKGKSYEAHSWLRRAEKMDYGVQSIGRVFDMGLPGESKGERNARFSKLANTTIAEPIVDLLLESGSFNYHQDLSELSKRLVGPAPHLAEKVFHHWLSRTPDDPEPLIRFGSFLISQLRLDIGILYLRRTWGAASHAQEVAFNLWVGTSLAGLSEPCWERVLKDLAEAPFRLFLANIFSENEAVLRLAEKILPHDESSYMREVDSFLRSGDLGTLSKRDRWTKLIGLDPKNVNSDGTFREK